VAVEVVMGKRRGGGERTERFGLPVSPSFRQSVAFSPHLGTSHVFGMLGQLNKGEHPISISPCLVF
jgi:hypothetical protein